ncbi:MAG: TonB-dependent receptor plug domain-containing protein [Deltaproteobacteria bacterium]|nr:TonB-dependent receptor plug domain-containing protein [Deltaproteobacteria bacterium]MBN2670142.1 TonB-dependent receptor plug domain-containing protein [Deltaproteobacteria bacterium]
MYWALWVYLWGITLLLSAPVRAQVVDSDTSANAPTDSESEAPIQVDTDSLHAGTDSAASSDTESSKEELRTDIDTDYVQTDTDTVSESETENTNADAAQEDLDLDLSSTAPPADAPVSAVSTDYQLQDATVVGQRRTEATAAAHYELEVGKLRIIPRKNVADQLMMAPGVLTTNHGGEGHANETYMRGFASKEGQDIEFLVDGVPLNEVSNPHNHGYADLYFIPPEMVQSVSITEGAFDPQQGDFAFAGTAEYRLGVDDRGAQVQQGLGLWNTHRTLVLYAPPDEETATFAGFEYFTTDGYGENRSAKRAVALGRFADDWGKQFFKYSISVYGYATRYDQPGVVRQDDYASGDMGFFDTYDSNQGGESNRFLLAFNTQAGPEHACFRQVSFFGYRTMRLRTNFTGWITDSTVDSNGEPLPAQRGDGLEMRYNVFTGGSRGDYTLSKSFFGQKQSLSIGYAARFDRGDAEQLRLRSITAIPYKQVFNNEFNVLNIAGWLRAQLRPLDWLALRGGVRIDTFSFGVTDHNQPDADREGERVPNQTSQSFGFALNPRVTLDTRIVKGLHALASYGQGTRSTDAAALSDNETAPFAQAQEFDTGVAYAHGTHGSPLVVNTQLSYSLTKVNKDLLFSETEGRNVLVGASTRHSVLLSGRVHLFDTVDVLANLGWTQATLDNTGELLPYIPQLIVRLEAAAAHQLNSWSVGKVPVEGRFGVSYTFVPGRPLPLKTFGDPFHVVGAGGDLRLWHFSVGVELRNLLNMKYRQAEFNYASNFTAPDAVSSRVPERHFVAGEPFYIMGTITWHLEDMIRAKNTNSEKGSKQNSEANGVAN